jgi:hypothetical protein
MDKLDVYKQLLRDSVTPDMGTEDALWRGRVLHMHCIALRPDLRLDDVRLDEGEQRVVLSPLTNNHVAELLASLWPSGEQRGRPYFWFGESNKLTPYEVFADIPANLRDRATAAKKAIEAHPLVAELIEE